MKLVTDDKALSLAIQLLQNDKDIQEQLSSDDELLKTQLLENDENIKSELSTKYDDLRAELSASDDAIKKEVLSNKDKLDTKAPIVNPEFTGKITVDGENVALSSDVDDKLRLTEPYIKGRELVANGYGIIIDRIDDETNRATYYTSGVKKYIDFPVGYSVCGGAVDGNCASSSIIMNSGNVNILQGGSDGDGSVSGANIVINGGTVKSIIGGGYPNLLYSGKANHVGNVNIIIRNVEGNPSIFGGGYSYASVGMVNIEIFDGAYDYVTVGGSNGSVGYGCVNVKGGTINVLQGVNHGYVGHAELCVDSGIVKSMYAGMEPGDSTIGSFGHTTIELTGGSVVSLHKGQNGDTSDYSNNYISGIYYDGVVDKNDAEAIGLIKKENSAILTIKEF